MEFGTEKLIIGSVKRHGKNRTTKPRKNQNTSHNLTRTPLQGCEYTL